MTKRKLEEMSYKVPSTLEEQSEDLGASQQTEGELELSPSECTTPQQPVRTSQPNTAQRTPHAEHINIQREQPTPRRLFSPEKGTAAAPDSPSLEEKASAPSTPVNMTPPQPIRALAPESVQRAQQIGRAYGHGSNFTAPQHLNLGTAPDLAALLSEEASEPSTPINGTPPQPIRMLDDAFRTPPPKNLARRLIYAPPTSEVASPDSEETIRRALF